MWVGKGAFFNPQNDKGNNGKVIFNAIIVKNLYFNRQNIIAQAGSFALSQANAVQQNVLRLLQ